MAGDPVPLLPTNAQGCCLLPVVCADSFGGGPRASRRARGRIPQVAAKQQLRNPRNCLELRSEGAESSRGRPLEAARALLYRSGWILHVPPSPGIRSARWPGKLAAFAKRKQKRRIQLKWCLLVPGVFYDPGLLGGTRRWVLHTLPSLVLLERTRTSGHCLS